MVHTTDLRGLGEVTNVGESVHPVLASRNLFLVHKVTALEDVHIGTTQHTPGFDLRLRHVNVEGVETHKNARVEHHGRIPVGHAHLGVRGLLFYRRSGCDICGFEVGVVVEPDSGTHPKDKSTHDDGLGCVSHPAATVAIVPASVTT